MEVYITGYGSKLVPRQPFCVTFRPPKLAIESHQKFVVFGPSSGDVLGFALQGDSTVEDVTSDVSEYPSTSTYGLYTPQISVPVTDRLRVYSTDAPGKAFEVQLEDAVHRDEMLWVQGPLPSELDLRQTIATLEVVGEGAVEKRNGAAPWLECRYVHESTTWHKRFYALTLLSTTKLGREHYFALVAQCPEARREALFDLSDRWAAGLGSRV